MNQMNWLAIAPEVVLLVMALVVAMVDLWVKHPRRTPTYLLAQASLVVGHGGHGTTMRTLRAGLPLVGMPAKGTDQASNLHLVEQLGAGRFLPPDADRDLIAATVTEVLRDPAYRAVAQRLSLDFVGRDGAALAADSLDEVLAARTAGAAT